MTTTHVAGILLALDDFDVSTLPELVRQPRFWSLGTPYAFTVLLILGTHEMGHYLACRHYGVRASLPFFLPGPPLFGTFGAVIRIRAPITDRRALFDIGVAGPIAGFVVAVPVLLYGLSRSTIVAGPPRQGEVGLPSCLLTDLLITAFFPDLGTGDAIRVDPTFVAAWIGLFATGLNLLPIGQLDGGHMLYAFSRRIHRAVSRWGVLVLVTAGVFFRGWHLVVFGIIFGILGPGHPPTLDERVPPGPGRAVVAGVGLILFVLCLIVRGPSIF